MADGAFPAWPTLNALLNATSAAFLLTGYARIRRRDVAAHRRAMFSATAASAVFLVSYLAYHTWKSRVDGTPLRVYPQVGFLRTVYLSILWSHSVLAGVLAFMVPRTLFLAIRGRHAEHRRIARVTYPLWVYVSVTGVVVYLMLYPFFPAEPPA